MDRQDDPCTTPRDGNDPNIWSHQVGAAPYSLLIGYPFDPKSPPPTYLSVDLLNKPRPTDKDSQLDGYVFYGDGGLLCTDERVLKNQRGVITDVIKQVTSCLLKGKGLVGMSLPIRLFEPRSTLERMLDRWSLAPVLFEGIEELGAMERFKKVIALAVSGLYISPSQEKPFNPLLGETLQAHWPDGTQAYCEHTSHHPPVTNFLVKGKHFEMFGHLELTGRFKKNSLIGGVMGTVNIKFWDGQIVTYTFPSFRAGGMIFGERTTNWEGEMQVEDKTNSLKAVVTFGPERKKSLFRRAVGKLDDFKGEIYLNKSKTSEITGSWLRNLLIDGEEIWNIDMQRPVFHQFPTNPLPSDWRYREDLVWLAKGNRDIAQNWKHRIENRQREDRKLRGLKY